MKCFYHSVDLDGQCSAALIKMAYPDCEMIGINYGDDFPWTEIKQGELIYMVDFSLQPFEEMIRLDNICQLMWIDHHKSAIEEAIKVRWDINPTRLKIGIGACQLVWESLKSDGYFQEPDSQYIVQPTFVKLLAEYDVWNHSDPRTLSFQYGMRLKDTSLENMDLWKSLFDVEMVQAITEEGGTVLTYIKQENKKYCDAAAFETELDGLKCIAVNKMLTNSQLFDSVWDNTKYDAMLTFGFSGKHWIISLYSDREDVDVSLIAKERGGGGHKGAAGFQCDELPFEINP